MKNYTLLVVLCFSMLLSCDRQETEFITNAAYVSEEIKVEKQSVVFIAGFDENEDGNHYYANASAHFKAKKMQVVEDLFTLEEILEWLSTNNNNSPYEEIHIVSHSNAWRGMSLKTTKDGARITTKMLTNVLEKKMLPKLDKRITKKTDVIFHSCGLGENKALLQMLQIVFASEQTPHIHASPYFNVFGGRYASHFLAKPYYVYYPTAQSQGPKALAEEIATLHPNVAIEWLRAIKNRGETKMGSAYSHRFNIPVEWEITFEKEEHVPEFQNREALMDWITDNDAIAMDLYELGIPIEKFRWTTSRSENRLKIKGKTTVVSVLQPITNGNDTSEYAVPNIDNPQLYTCL